MKEILKVSVVIPICNEEENLDELFSRLEQVFNQMNRPYEVVFIDDGSTDTSYQMLKSYHEQDPNLRVLHFSRNFGQQAAVTAGFEYARGDVLLVMDGDLQIEPEDIPKLLAKIDEGYDAAVGYRLQRHEPFLTRRLPSLLANKLFSKMLGVPFKDFGCGMQAFRRSILEGLDKYGTMYNHAAIFAVWRGSTIAEVPIGFKERKSGTTKYGLSNLVALFLDIFITFSTQPIQLFFSVLIGGISVLLGGILAVVLGVGSLFGSGQPTTVAVVLMMFLFFMGFQLIAMGIQNERISRVNKKLQNSPIFIVDEVIEKSAASTRGL